ncbi:cysteine desulfurase / selenocysteine lyase [Phycisphaerales bacterium]|nr:cysteine desulfurase / selenocysteine lyase [Phycisphaerales bacterium]
MRRLYLDNAATSYPKPPAVYDAMFRYGRDVGASPGRGQYSESREGARLIRDCRERVCRLIGGTDPSHVVFTLNTSDALNLAIKGVVRAARLASPGSPMRLVTTAMDHNSVLRPFQALADEGVEVVHVPADPVSGLVSAASVEAELSRPGTTVLVAANMASNVTGTIQPVAEIGEVCRRHGVLLLVDAAQALGHMPVDVREIGCDLLAFPGHKGLMGPQGTGGLYIRPGVEDRVATTREGGTGSWSESDSQPGTMPERYEAGSHNTIGIVGLREAVGYVLERGLAALRGHEVELIDAMLVGLRELGVRHPEWPTAGGPCGALRLLGPVETSRRVGVFALVHDELEPGEIAAVLEGRFGILARSGITCAPRAHAAMGTLGRGGAVRLSFGPFVTVDDVRYALAAIRSVCEGELRDVSSSVAGRGDKPADYRTEGAVIPLRD